MPDEATGSLPGLAGNLARLIDAGGWSAAQVAERSGLSRERIDGLLGDDVEPSATELLCLAGALEVRPGQILEGIAWESDGAGGGRLRVDRE
jgi:transcriptional regulator with XRE-family HTH domain